MGRRKAIWSLFWIALLGSSAAGHGSASIFRSADLELGERQVIEHNCQACRISPESTLACSRTR